MQFLDCVDGAKHRAILTTCHAAGLRISEVICLKTDNIDSQRMVIRVDQGKGQKDRYVMLSPTLLEILRSWWRMNKPRHWLFPSDLPGQHISKDAVELACQKARRLSGIRKPITNSIGSLIRSHAMLPKQKIAGLCYLPTDTAEINCPSALKELTGMPIRYVIPILPPPCSPISQRYSSPPNPSVSCRKCSSEYARRHDRTPSINKVKGTTGSK
jgi:hypothetical protein